jgi:hypothetical protein
MSQSAKKPVRQLQIHKETVRMLRVHSTVRAGNGVSGVCDQRSNHGQNVSCNSGPPILSVLFGLCPEHG